MTKHQEDAEAAFAKKAYSQRSAINQKAREAILASTGTRQVTIIKKLRTKP